MATIPHHMRNTIIVNIDDYQTHLNQQKRFIPEHRLMHPLRKVLTDQDYERLYRIALGISDEQCSETEVAAFEDFLFDKRAFEIQTAPAIAYLQ